MIYGGSHFTRSALHVYFLSANKYGEHVLFLTKHTEKNTEDIPYGIILGGDMNIRQYEINKNIETYKRVTSAKT